MLAAFLRGLRILLIGLVLLTALAIGLGRVAPPHTRRQLGAPPIVQVSSYLIQSSLGRITLLDPQAGRLRNIDLARGHGFDSFSASPWTDSWGERHLAGRWCSTSGREADTLFQGFGLARVSYPSGTIIDAISSDIYPVSPPCWFHGTTARILFPAGDGQLYTYSFEAEVGRPAPPDRSAPRPLRWSPERFAQPPGLVVDVCWGSSHESGRVLLATVMPTNPGPRTGEAPHSEIWWFRLDPRGESLVDGGPLGLPDRPATLSLRRPALGHAITGDQVLACLAETGHGSLDLVVLELEEADSDGPPRVRPGSLRRLASGCAPMAPTFTPDGLWIAYASLQTPRGPLHVARAPLPVFLGPGALSLLRPPARP